MASSTQNKESNDWICTQIKGDHIEYEWTIKNFESLPQKNGEFIKSSIFPAYTDKEQWQLEFYPNGHRKQYSGWISVFLGPVGDEMVPIEVEFEISIIRSKKIVRRCRGKYKYESLMNYGFHALLERSQLTQEDNAVTICCKIDVVGIYLTSSFHSSSVNDVISFESKRVRLSDDFNSLYKNPRFTDFTIISGNEKIPTHKNILASRTVFATMFEHDEMNEKIKNEVGINNMETNVVKAMLEYIYTDNVSNPEKLARGLLAAAEQYALEGLKTLCEKTLYKELDQNNVIEIFMLADLYHAEQLKKHVKKYILDHREDILTSEKFDMTEISPALLRELIRAFALPQSVGSKESSKS